ncbi:hypothetical protein Acsp01_22420 [Actinoplanes sp. NBRC 101535]|nr:hypothetical protein Acsp01_22420 [Actinoplanes sp. NBRC 101535]
MTGWGCSRSQPALSRTAPADSLTAAVTPAINRAASVGCRAVSVTSTDSQAVVISSATVISSDKWTPSAGCRAVDVVSVDGWAVVTASAVGGECLPVTGKTAACLWAVGQWSSRPPRAGQSLQPAVVTVLGSELALDFGGVTSAVCDFAVS